MGAKNYHDDYPRLRTNQEQPRLRAGEAAAQRQRQARLATRTRPARVVDVVTPNRYANRSPEMIKGIWRLRCRLDQLIIDVERKNKPAQVRKLKRTRREMDEYLNSLPNPELSQEEAAAAREEDTHERSKSLRECFADMRRLMRQTRS